MVHKGPSIYDIHTEGGSSSDGCMRTEEGVKPHVDVHTEKLKLESTNVILSSSHAKKLVSSLPEFCLWNKKWKLFGDIN